MSIRKKIRQLIVEEMKDDDEEEEVIQGEEHDEEEDVEERVGVENAESGNYYKVNKSHALNNPQKYNKIRENALRRVVRKRIHEVVQEARVGGEGQMEYGFDLTEFRNAKSFRSVIDTVGLKGPKKETTDYGTEQYVFETDGLRLVTSENPLERPEPGYASYMGITGEARKVQKLVDAIKEKAAYIKGESPGQRDYI